MNKNKKKNQLIFIKIIKKFLIKIQIKASKKLKKDYESLPKLSISWIDTTYSLIIIRTGYHPYKCASNHN